MRDTQRRLVRELTVAIVEDGARAAYRRPETLGTRVARASFTARNTSTEPVPEFSKERIVAIRGKLELSQRVFAQALNVSAATVRAWEQGKRVPDGAALRLLRLADAHSQWVLETVHVPEARTPRYRSRTRSDLTDQR
jgi:DNA-binding transcriptional regulator YiaG